MKNSDVRAVIVSAATFGLLIVAGRIEAGTVAGGAVTGGSAFTAGGKFIDLDPAQNFTLTANLPTGMGLNPIPAGTKVNSAYVTFGSATTAENLSGYV
ncbi:MAG: hypothetical protein JO279_15225, partial [Verrucomicrobia bacterium]|nr:hypothetical protein [Verrucomicrobiota bacterium]